MIVDRLPASSDEEPVHGVRQNEVYLHNMHANWNVSFCLCIYLLLNLLNHLDEEPQVVDRSYPQHVGQMQDVFGEPLSTKKLTEYSWFDRAMYCSMHCCVEMRTSE